ncbi:MAG TPA: translation initiation factor IF-3 [Bacteroidales bacterium]|nr:translation initiation factor IF-3 [Bacteroidales bacterium]
MINKYKEEQSIATPFTPRPFANRRVVKQEDPHAINARIKAPVVRVVGENVEPAIIPIKEALALAAEHGLDLVEIAPAANPPVCKIMDYKKFLYELKKKQKEIKANAAKIVIKEIRLGPNTDDHDFNFKLKHAVKFLEEGAKLKVYVFFKGRSIVYKEQGEVILLRFAQEVEEVGKVEQLPKLEGKRMIMLVSPKKSPKKK